MAQKPKLVRPHRDLKNGRFLPSAANFVDDMIWSNCQRPFYIYVATAIPCLVDAVIMLRLWDFGDMVRATGEAAAHAGAGAKRGARHGRPLRGPQAPGSGRERRYSQGLNTLLRLTAPLEKIGFALLVYSVIDNFYFDWAMYLDDADACIGPGFYGPLIRQAEPGEATPNPEGGTIPLPTLVANGANWANNAFGASLPIGRYKMVLAITFKGPTGGNFQYRAGLIITGALGTGEFRGPSVTTTPGQEATCMLDADVLLPFVTGGGVAWELVGPSVPIGIDVVSATIYIARRDSALD